MANIIHKTNIKKYFIIVISLIILIAMICIAIYIYKSRDDQNSIVATINGEPVTMDEYLLFNSANRSETFKYFQEKYSAQIDNKFWTKNFEGEIPVEILKTKTLDQLKNIKVEQILMKENGVADDISYQSFLAEFQKENEARKEKVEKGEAIYGPQQYSTENFYTLIHDNRVSLLKEKLINNSIDVSNYNLQQYYEIAKDTYFKKPDYIKYQMVKIPFDNTDDNTAIDKINEANNLLQNNSDFESVMKSFNENGNIIEKTFGDEESQRDYKFDGIVLDSISKLQIGKISEPITASSYYCIIKCLDIKDQGYYPFDEMTDVIETRYIDYAYNNLIIELVEEAKVETYFTKAQSKEITK